MANIHITLVGGQTTPVYQGIIASNPDRVILIHSAQTETEANRINAELEVDCELRRFDPVDLKQINDAILKLKINFSKNDQITINVGGGTKPWSIMFYEYFRMEENAQLFYIDQNNLMWNLKTHENKDIHFDMDAQFRLLGNPLTTFRSFAKFSEDDKKVVAELQKLRKFHFDDFNSLTERLSRFPNEIKAISKTGSELIWSTTDKSFSMCLQKKTGQAMQGKFKSPLVRELLLNAGWFEYHVASILFKWSKAKDIRMNCVFPTKIGLPKNEIDIIVNAGSKLLFVECKTSIYDNTDIDKFASAVKVYGGLGSKALFVTEVPMKEKALEKCADHGIMFFSLQNNSSKVSPEDQLFEMLDKELSKLNTR